jgi:hypothetical protein
MRSRHINENGSFPLPPKTLRRREVLGSISIEEGTLPIAETP